MQIVELHYTAPCPLDREAIRDRAQQLLSTHIELPDSEGDKSQLFVHVDFVTQFKDGAAPCLTAVLGTDEKPSLDNMQDKIEQSWRTKDAGDLLAKSNATLLVTEMMCEGIEAQPRLANFHGVLQALVEITKPCAMVFTHTHQVIDPADYLESCGEKPILRAGALNVRFYNISNGDAGDMIMDTRGLTEIGLHDLQCHFRGLDEQAVAGVLYNTGVYVCDNGPVIESGQTVDGSEPGSRWVCQFEDSLLEPKRDILDLNPGPPYAAGEREPGGAGPNGGGLLGRIGRLFGRG